MIEFLARMMVYAAPVIFGAMAVSVSFMVYEGVRDGYIMFGSGRRLFQFDRNANALTYYLLLAFYCCAAAVCLKMIRVSWRWAKEDLPYGYQLVGLTDILPAHGMTLKSGWIGETRNRRTTTR